MIKHATTAATFIAIAAVMAGCKRENDSGSASTTEQTKAADQDHDHGPGADHSHDDAAAGAPAPGHGGAIIELGATTIGPFTVRASRDEGEITPGGDAPIDVWLSGGDPASVTAVRFWIGTQSGDESVKAKADIENAAEPDRWHTHAEVPSPIPTGSKLWVEIEIEGEGKQVGSFDLKA